MGILLQIFLTDAPSDGITGHQQFIDLLLGKAVLQQADAHIAALRKACQNNGTAIVVVLQIIEEGILYICIGKGEIFLPVFRRQLIDIQPGLAVIGSKESGIRVIDALFHIGGTQKVALCVFVVHRHIEAVLIAAINSGADEEYIRVSGFIHFQIGPVFRLGVG